MIKTTISLLVAASLAMLGSEVVYARGCGGAHGGGGSRGGYSGGESRGGYSGGAQRGGESARGGSREGYSGRESRGEPAGGQRGGESARGGSRGEYPGGEPRGESAAEGRRGGESSRAGPPSGAEGAAAGAAAANRNQPQHSGAQGAAAGAAAANRNQPQYSGAQGAAAGAAAANRNQPQYSGAQGAAAGYAAAGWAGSSAAHVGLPTDVGFGAAAATGAGAAAYVGNHQTLPVSASAYAARGAATRSAVAGSGAFGQGWYAAHPGAWNPTGWAAGQAWGASAWPSVGAWCGWSAGAQPVYYDYGNSVSYQGNQVYYGDQPVATADQYYQQASTLAQTQAAPDPKAGEWMPLGVFGLVRGAESDPHYIMQVAVNKSGAVGGNYYDVVSGTTVPIQGAVDKETQRLAWTVGDNKNTVGETGIFNLTKDEAPALIHIGKDKTQQWTLVRLKQPETQSAQQ